LAAGTIPYLHQKKISARLPIARSATLLSGNRFHFLEGSAAGLAKRAAGRASLLLFEIIILFLD